MKKAVEADDQIFWWIGMHKDENSAQFDIKQTQSLVHSWTGGEQPTPDLQVESCVGFGSSLAIQSKDCGDKEFHSAICQFGNHDPHLPSITITLLRTVL